MSDQSEPMRMTTNGSLPPAREAVVEQGNRVYQEVAHERDQLLRKVSELQSDIAGYKVALEAHSSMEAQRDSRTATLQAERDDAVARRATLEATLNNIQSVLNTYHVGAEPMVKPRGDEDEGDRIAQELHRGAANRAGSRITGL